MSFYELTQGRHYEKDPENKGKDIEYKPGDVVEFKRPLPEAFKDRFKLVTKGADQGDDVVEGEEGDGDTKRRRKEPFVYEPLHKGGGQWVVLDDQGNAVNDNYVSKKVAKQLADEMNAEAEAAAVVQGGDD